MTGDTRQRPPSSQAGTVQTIAPNGHPKVTSQERQEGTSYGVGLFDQHQAKLESSAISVDVARERGYVTADTAKGLHRHGFSKAQCEVMRDGGQALVIPLWDVFGERAGHQMRPDAPRALKGRIAKYETQFALKMMLDVPPRIRPHLGDPSRSLFITEGPLKADSMVSAGLDTVALLGVWNWRGTNNQGGKVALPDWEQVALEDRQVYVVFDSDAMLKQGVHDACARLGAYLGRRGAHVAYVYLPSENGQKVGADDYLANGGTAAGIVALATSELRKLPGEPTEKEPVDTFADVPDESGHRVLDELRDWLAAHVAYESPHHAPTVALWCAHTHALDIAASSPRLAFESPEPESGKSRNLELMEPVCRKGKLVLQMSAASVYRWVSAMRPTILLDEIDAVFGPKASHEHENLRAIINAGHRPGATIPRVDKDTLQVVEFECYSAVALAGLAGGLPHTIRSRSVRIPMRRRAPDETIRPWRERITRPEGEALGRRLAAWVKRHSEEIPDAPELREGVTDRQADQWEALIAIADAAGGHWPKTARAACSAIVGEARGNTDDQSLTIRLLSDIRGIFEPDESRGAEAMFSADLLEALTGIEEAPWGDWFGKAITARWLADKLKPHGVKPHQIRIGEVTKKGYEAKDFKRPWSIYLPPSQKRNKGNKGNIPARDVSDVSDVSLANGSNGQHATPPYETGTCELCGLAMTIIEEGQTAHPLCLETGGKW
jgi:hypothetical protein